MLSKRSGSESRSPRPFHLTDLPEVPLDKVISYLTDEDLRRFHQVSRSWKAALESRCKEDRRRKELAKKIQENKENIRNGSSTPQETVPLAMAQLAIRERSSDAHLDGKKSGNSCILMECTNQVNTPTSVINSSSNASTPAAGTTNFLTPISLFEFQEFPETEPSLEDESGSVYSPRRIYSNSQLDVSQFSDSGISFGGSIDDFRNMVYSPTDTPARHFSDRSGSTGSMISSDQFESFSFECNNNISNSFGVDSSTSMISNNNKRPSNVKSSKQKKQKKTQLRRLAKL